MLFRSVQALAHTAVAAIEQKYSASSPGSTLKKQEAMQMLLELCKALKLPLDATHASAALEAAVFELNAWTKIRATQTPTMPLPVATPTPGAVRASTQKPMAAG